MKSTHAHLGITQADFDALVEDLVKSLDKFQVAQAEQDELLQILGPMKSDIVTR
jgi:hemoglobin